MRLPMFVRLIAAAALLSVALPAQQVITGKAAFADWSQERPGVRRKITIAEMSRAAEN